MKIQELAIIFIIIILPISLLLSEYTQFQIKTINMQTAYDAKLTDATYDAIKAFQLNSTNSTTSDLSNSKMRDIEASVNSFRNSIMAGFELNGYTEEALNNYIPALVYTLYDGFYIYSPYKNVVNENGEIIEDDNAQESLYGLKPYINYSCRYSKDSGTDVVITYALDNHITVQGIVDGEYVNKSGYLIDNIKIDGDNITYNGVSIEKEQLKEYLPVKVNGIVPVAYPYAKINGTKYYLIEDYSDGKDCIVYILNGTPIIQYKDGDTQFISWRDMILNNNSAIQYYKDAQKFTDWLKNTSLKDLQYSHAIDEVIRDDGTIEITNVWQNDNRKIFEFNSTLTASNNIENELSEFNQHRLAVIRHKIETNLAVAISNYNDYSGADNVFQMPSLKEDEWEQITHNISLISFLQGLPIGGKIYNGYSIVTNSESKEVVLEEYIYILGDDNNYHKIGDTGFEIDGTLAINAGNYEGSSDGSGKTISAGRLNLDFEKNLLVNSDNTVSSYYYSLKEYNASYDSVVMQNKVTTYDDIYAYVNDCGNEDLKKAFYTALGRERYSAFKSSNTTVEYYSVLVVGTMSSTTSSSQNTYKEKIRKILDELGEDKEINVTYIFSTNAAELNNCVQEQMNNYNLIIVNSFVWETNINPNIISDASNVTNIITIGNDILNLEIMKREGQTKSTTIVPSTVIPEITEVGENKIGNITITGRTDGQAAFYFNDDVEVFYTGRYTGGTTGEYDLIGCWQKGNYKWIHSQVSLENDTQMKLLKELVKYALDID